MSSAYRPSTGGPPRAQTSNISGSAFDTIRQAFERLENTVTLEDRRKFQDTRLEDVRDAALQVEKDLAARRSLKNMRRLYPFLQGLDHYSKSIEVLCNGTPYLPWIWAPVKLMLQITSDHLSAFEKLIEAYGKIADALPRFDRLSTALKDDHNFQAVVSLMYADILEFHRRAYKFIRRRSWKFFFTSMWDNFDSRFKSILANLAYHSDLVDKEAVSFDIVASANHRKEDLERFKKQKREWKNAKLNATLSWLGFSSQVVDYKLDKLTRLCSQESCEWLLKHPKIVPWLDNKDKSSVVWLHGKPGAGKSVLSANLVQHLEANLSDVFFYFCSYSDATAGTSGNLFRSLVAQIVQAHGDTAIYVCDNYVNSYRAASRKALSSLLPELLEIIGTTHLVIDGLDEWDLGEQQSVLEDILPLALSKGSPKVCKIFISSRDMPTISRMMRHKKRASTVLSLDEEHVFVSQSIQSFITKTLDEYRNDLEDLDPTGSILSDIGKLLVKKSNGMFLWVRLVLDSLDSIHTPEDLRQMVTLLPSDLEDLYRRIIDKIYESRNKINHLRATAILQWITYAQRPLKSSEILHALALASGDPSPNIQNVPIFKVFEICKPLVEQRPDGTVGFVHFSVQEYLKSDKSAISSAIDAHQLISLACATALSQGLRLLHPDIDPLSRSNSLANGVYGLMKYALQFWQEHVLSFATEGGNTSENAVLTNSLYYLYQWHTHIRIATNHEEIHGDTVNTASSSEAPDERLQHIAHLPISSIVSESLRLRRISRTNDSSDGKAIETFAIKHDRTLMSKLAVEFESWILDLLSRTSIEGTSDHILAKSQAAFAGSAYRCRYPFCSALSNSFATPSLRTQHEATHVPCFYCSNTACLWNRIGFKNDNALQRHIREHHDKEHRLKTLTKTRLLSGDVSADSVRKRNRKRMEDNWPPVFSYPQEGPGKEISAARYLDKVSPNYMRQGRDWFAFFEPHQPRKLDIEMVYPHDSMHGTFNARISPCGRYLSTVHDHWPLVRNLFTGETLTLIENSKIEDSEDDISMNIQVVCFVPNTNRVVGACMQGFVFFWSFDHAERELPSPWHAHDDYIYSIDVSNDGTRIATGSEDCTVKIWTTAGPNKELDSNGLATPIQRFDLELNAIDVAISRDGRFVVATCGDGSIYVLEIMSGKTLAKLSGHRAALSSVAISPCDSYVVSGSYDGTVRVWQLDQTIQYSAEDDSYGGSCVRTIAGHAQSVLSVAISPDGLWIFSAGADQSVRVVDAETGALQCIIVGHEYGVEVHISPTGGYFVTSSSDALRIWRYKPYQESLSDTDFEDKRMTHDPPSPPTPSQSNRPRIQ